MPFPDFFPAFSRLMADNEGRVWALRYPRPSEAEREWWTFEEGRWTGRLRHDASFEPLDMADGKIAGVWSDELGVEFVRVYRVVEGS